MRSAAVVAALAVVLSLVVPATAQSQFGYWQNDMGPNCFEVDQIVLKLFDRPKVSDGWDAIFSFPGKALTAEYAEKFNRAANQLIPRLKVKPSAVAVSYIPDGAGYKAFVVSSTNPDIPWIFFLDEGYFTEYTDEEFVAILAHEFAHPEFLFASSGNVVRSQLAESDFDVRGIELTSIEATLAALERKEEILRSVRTRYQFELGRCSASFWAFYNALARSEDRLNKIGALRILATKEETRQ